MPDVKATFYGEGLVQAMAKDYVPEYKNKNMDIAFSKPELISDEYRKLNAQLHADNLGYGVGGGRHAKFVLQLTNDLKTQSVLDYGCGKGYLAKALPFPIWEYDPAIEGKDQPPRPADIVLCTDVLEHIEPERLDFVLDDLQRCTKKVGYFVISTRLATKTLADGRNTHLIVQNKDWWYKKISRYFKIAQVIWKNEEIHMIVSSNGIRKHHKTQLMQSNKC
jgi:2-polyprenyl-3-methyl-5-hydroxy-6-metoxy-1,4-benzoquinol methylase